MTTAPNLRRTSQRRAPARPGATGLSRGGTSSQSTSTSARIVLTSVLRSENSNFYLLLGTVIFLVLIGLIVVFSASSIGSYLEDGWFFGGFVKQATFAAIGIPLMLIISRLPLVFWSTWARRMLAIGVVLQMLVFSPIGIETGGNRNWIAIGTFTAQPSELIKIVLAVWLGVALPVAIEKVGLYNWRVLRPVIAPALLMGLVLVGSDLGTAMIMGIIVMGCLLFAGLPLRILLIPTAIGGLLVWLLVGTSPNRMARILSFLTIDDCTDYTNTCWQPLHGLWALANGGIFGVGLGNSKSKWSWLPAADNDYIFAIIGEEMGLIGCLVVITLYVFLTILFLRIIRATHNPLVRITTAGIMFWIIGQAAINIGVVVGIVPVLGVPLPFLSSGGTALAANLIAVGIVLSFARAERDSQRMAGTPARGPHQPRRATSPRSRVRS